METVVGIFTTRKDAERAAERIRASGVPSDRVSFLSPAASDSDLASVPTTETEQPGVGTAIGGVVGGAIGASGGALLGPATASVLLPGLGPVVAVGALATAVLGALGAIGGAVAGGSLEQTFSHGLPKDELLFYEEALRHDRSVLIVLAEDEEQAEDVRSLIAASGAEDLDTARERWWIGLRDPAKAERPPSPLDGGSKH